MVEEDNKMPVVQPYFQVDSDRSTPLFAMYFNGFMQRRTIDNMNFMARFLDNQDTEFLNSQIEAIRKNRQELIMERTKMVAADRKAKNELLNTILKGKFDAARANTGIQEAMIRGSGSIIAAGIRGGLSGKDFNAKLAKVKEDKQSIKGLFNNPTNTGYNDVSNEFGSSKDANVFLDYMKREVGRTTQSFDQMMNDPVRKKAAIATFLQQLMERDQRNFFKSGADGQQVLENIAPALGLGTPDLSTPAQLFKFKKDLSDIVKGPQQVATAELIKLSQEVGQKGMEMLNPMMGIKRLDKDIIEPLEKKSSLTEGEKKTLKQAKIDKAVLLEAVKKTVRGGGVSSRTLNRIQKKIAPHLDGKHKSDAIANLDMEISALGQELQAKGLLRREKIMEIRREGPSRAFKPFKKNYLLESPFKIETDESRKKRDFVRIMRTEAVKPKKPTRSSYFKNLQAGQIYSPIRTPELRVGVTAQEQPFIVRDGAPFVVDSNDGMYNSLLQVLENINKQYGGKK
jgi:hypothetical protein